MKKGLLLFIFISFLGAETPIPIIKIKGETLLEALAYTENSDYEKLYNWNIGSKDISPITWDPNGNNWTPNGFERKGKVYLTNNGKITHTLVNKEIKPGYWNLLMLGDKNKITKITILPNKVTNENPTILIDKAFFKKKIVCEENKIFKKSVYQIKFPKKVSFWMIEKKNISADGEESIYTLTYDKKPKCASKTTEDATTSSILKESSPLKLLSKKEREKTFKIKNISFSMNGIDIHLTYPTSIYSGEKFKIKAEMTNKNKDAKQGGLTLSFPDMESMTGMILKNNFSSLKGYSYPDKIFNKDTRKTMKTEYYMVEGWQNKKWAHNQKKYFTVELKAPKKLSELSVNLRGVLWIKNKHDIKEIPLDSSIKDQQGFAVKQFSIDIINKEKQSKKSIPLKQGMSYSQARKALLDSGWQATSTRWQDISEYGRENDFYYKNGWHEVEVCSGTGLGYCLFNFHDADGNKIRVVTAGESNDPVVDNWRRM